MNDPRMQNERFLGVVPDAVPAGWHLFIPDGVVAVRSESGDALAFTIKHPERGYFVVSIHTGVFTGWTDQLGNYQPPITDDELRELLAEEFRAGVS